jgi:hypothetical protein
MKVEVTAALDDIKRQFPEADLSVRDDGQGGAYVVATPVRIGNRFRPETTWLGFHIPPLYPYADIYPVFMGAEVVRADGTAFVAPVTPNASFEGRAAIQISRRSGAASNGQQKVTTKLLKVLDFLEKMP